MLTGPLPPFSPQQSKVVLLEDLASHVGLRTQVHPTPSDPSLPDNGLSVRLCLHHRNPAFSLTGKRWGGGGNGRKKSRPGPLLPWQMSCKLAAPLGSTAQHPATLLLAGELSGPLLPKKSSSACPEGI